MTKYQLYKRRLIDQNANIISDHKYENHKKRIKKHFVKLQKILPIDPKTKLKFTEFVIKYKNQSQPLGSFDSKTNTLFVNERIRQYDFMLHIFLHEYAHALRCFKYGDEFGNIFKRDNIEFIKLCKICQKKAHDDKWAECFGQCWRVIYCN